MSLIDLLRACRNDHLSSRIPGNVEQRQGRRPVQGRQRECRKYNGFVRVHLPGLVETGDLAVGQDSQVGVGAGADV